MKEDLKTNKIRLAKLLSARKLMRVPLDFFFPYHTAYPGTPPEGLGFQLWSFVLKGSPISPVFDTEEDLYDWCASNATTFGFLKATSDEWRELLNE
jgi:hypothetical protein